jgi:glycosyltransferase involved in cell wall biosynthesis
VLVPPGDARALASALRRLLGDDGTRARLGERARQRVQDNFSAETTSRAVTRIYEEVLASARG